MMNAEKPDLGIGTDPGVLTQKRKQGRPRKDHALPSRERGLVLHKVDGNARKFRRRQNVTAWPTVTDSDFIGQQVHGVLDGSFDAGYLLTVRVGGSQTVLRGVLFEPSLSMPISKANDIAPNVKFTMRDEHIVPSTGQHPTSMAITLVASSPTQGLLEGTLLTPTRAGASVTQNSPSRDLQSSQLPHVLASAQVTLGPLHHEGSSPKTLLTLQEHSNTELTSQPEESGSGPILQEPRSPTPEPKQIITPQQADLQLRD
eukprot:c25651_g1_i2 orf=358-1131(-)